MGSNSSLQQMPGPHTTIKTALQHTIRANTTKPCFHAARPGVRDQLQGQVPCTKALQGDGQLIEQPAAQTLSPKVQDPAQAVQGVPAEKQPQGLHGHSGHPYAHQVVADHSGNSPPNSRR